MHCLRRAGRELALRALLPPPAGAAAAGGGGRCPQGWHLAGAGTPWKGCRAAAGVKLAPGGRARTLEGSSLWRVSVDATRAFV